MYFTDSYTGKVTKVPIAGGPETVVGTGPYGADGIVLDDRYVYWVTTCGRMLRAAK